MEWRSLCYLHLLEPLNRYYDTCRHLKKIAEDSSADYSQYFKWSYLWDSDTGKTKAVQEIAGNFREVYDTCMHLRKLSTAKYQGCDVYTFGKSPVCGLGETEIEKIEAAVKDKKVKDKIKFFNPPAINESLQDYCQKAEDLQNKISELLPDFSKSLGADISALHAGLPYPDYIGGYLNGLNKEFGWKIPASDLSEFVFLAVYKFIFGPNQEPANFNGLLNKNKESYKFVFNGIAQLYGQLRNKQVKELETALKEASRDASKLHKEDTVFKEFQSKLLEYSFVQSDKWNSEYSPDKEDNSRSQMSLSFHDKSVYVGEYGDLTYKYGNFEIILSPKVFFNFLENENKDLLKNFKSIYTNKCKKIGLKEILGLYKDKCKKGEGEEIEKMKEAMDEVEVGSLLKFELPNPKKSKQNEGVCDRLGNKIKIFRAKTPQDSYKNLDIEPQRFCADVAVCVYTKANIDVVYSPEGKQDISEEDKPALKMNNLLYNGLVLVWGNFRIVSLLVDESEEYYIQRLPKPPEK